MTFFLALSDAFSFQHALLTLCFFFYFFAFILMIFYHFAPAWNPEGRTKDNYGWGGGERWAQYMRQNEWKEILHLTCFSSPATSNVEEEVLVPEPVCVLGLLQGSVSFCFFFFFICLLNGLSWDVTLMNFILNAYRHVVAFIHSHNMDMSSYQRPVLKTCSERVFFSLDSLCLSLIAKRDSNPTWSVVKNKNKSTERVVVAGLTHRQGQTDRQTHVRL